MGLVSEVRSKAKKNRGNGKTRKINFQRYPDEEEVAEALNMDPKDYLAMLKDYGNLLILSIEGCRKSQEKIDKIIQRRNR